MQTAIEPKRGAGARRRECERPEDFVTSWFFPIPMPAFQAALDIERSERAKTTKGPDGKKRRRTWHVWSQRAEPQWAFVAGDVFHAPSLIPAPWGEQQATLRWSVQVKEVLGSAVTIAVTEHREGRHSEHEVTMDGVAELLRTGRLPPLFDFADSLASHRPSHVG